MEVPAPERTDAWWAISDLFLDTWFDDDDIPSLARRLQAIGFGVDELERIYEDEVAPVCWSNLYVMPGGIWGAFNREWLVDAIPRRLAGPRSRLPWRRRLRVWWQTNGTRADWERVRALLS